MRQIDYFIYFQISCALKIFVRYTTISIKKSLAVNWEVDRKSKSNNRKKSSNQVSQIKIIFQKYQINFQNLNYSFSHFSIESYTSAAVCFLFLSKSQKFEKTFEDREKVFKMSTILEKIADIEAEMARTQKNKATAGHLGMLKAKLAKLRRELITPKSQGGASEQGFEVAKVSLQIPIFL